jgi:sodium-dependent dicarboxylate transporter 2/3/5
MLTADSGEAAGGMGDRALVEESGGLSFGEAQFERIPQTAGLFAGPFAFVAVWLLPIAGLSVEAHRLAAIVSLVVVWWVTEAVPIPATALIGTALTVALGATAQEAFAPFASPVIFLFVGSFIIGRAISEHRLDYRIALSLLALGGVRGNLDRMRLALAGLAVVLSAWMSNTATTAMMVPVALGVIRSSGAAISGGSRAYTSGFLLTLAYATAVVGLTTPVGSPPNLITIGLLDRLAGVRIDFVSWMMLMTPIALAIGAAMYILSTLFFPKAGVSGGVEPHLPQIGPLPKGLTPGQRNCVIAFALAVVLWVTPGLSALLGATDSDAGRLLTTRLDEGVVAVVAASLLFLLPVDWRRRRFTLRWSEASRIDWGTILLFGGGLSLGHQMFQTGLAEQVGMGLVATTGAESLWAVTAMALALGIMLTEITSNTATTNMLVPVVISICQAGDLNPVPPALGAALGASMAFMLPISTPPNAIIYGTGYVRITEMIKFGLWLDAIGFVIGIAELRILCPLLGLS